MAKKFLFTIFLLGLILPHAINLTQASTLINSTFACSFDASETCTAEGYKLIYFNGTTPVGIYREYSLNNSATGHRQKLWLEGINNKVLLATDANDNNLNQTKGQVKRFDAVLGTGAFSDNIFITYISNDTATCGADKFVFENLKYNIATNTTSALSDFCARFTTSNALHVIQGLNLQWDANNASVQYLGMCNPTGAGVGFSECRFQINPTTGALSNIRNITNTTSEINCGWGGLTNFKLINNSLHAVRTEIRDTSLSCNGKSYDAPIYNATFSGNGISYPYTTLIDAANAQEMPLIYSNVPNYTNPNELGIIYSSAQSGVLNIKLANYNCSNGCTPDDLTVSGTNQRLTSHYQSSASTVFFTYNQSDEIYYDKFCPFGASPNTLGVACSSAVTGNCSDGPFNACSSDSPGYFCNSQGELVPLPGVCSCPSGETWQLNQCVNLANQFNETMIDVYVEGISTAYTQTVAYVKAKVQTDGVNVPDATCTLTLSNSTAYPMTYITGSKRYVEAGYTATIDITNYYEFRAVDLMDQWVTVRCAKGNFDETLNIKIHETQEDFTSWNPTLVTPTENNKVSDFIVYKNSIVYANLFLGAKDNSVSNGLFGFGNREDDPLPQCVFKSDDLNLYLLNPNLFTGAFYDVNGVRVRTEMRLNQQLVDAENKQTGRYFYTWLCYNTHERYGHAKANIRALNIIDEACTSTTTKLTIDAPGVMIQNSQTDSFLVSFKKSDDSTLPSNYFVGSTCNYNITNSTGAVLITDIFTLDEFGSKEVTINGSNLPGENYTIDVSCSPGPLVQSCVSNASESAGFIVYGSTCAGTVNSCGLSTCSVCNTTTVITCNDGASRTFGEYCRQNFECITDSTPTKEFNFCRAHSGYYFEFDTPLNNTYCDVAPDITAKIYTEQGILAAGINSLDCKWTIKQDGGFLVAIQGISESRSDINNLIPIPYTSFWKSTSNVCVNGANREYILSCTGFNKQNATAQQVAFAITGSTNRVSSDRRVTQVCEDGTSIGKCSDNQPYYCTSDLTLVPNSFIFINLAIIKKH